MCGLFGTLALLLMFTLFEVSCSAATYLLKPIYLEGLCLSDVVMN